MSDNVLEVRNLKAYYRVLKGEVKAVDGITFSIRRGEILGLAGESGCGKSTLANTLISRKPPLHYISGDVKLLGKDIIHMPNQEFRTMRLRNISLIPQYALDAFSPTKKISTFITDLIEEHGIKVDRKLLSKIKERLYLVNLDPAVLDKYCIELSGGMRQRVIMVISTILDPEFLIADEITSALDVSSQRFAATMLSNFRDDGIIGSAMLITHDLSVLYQIADRIMIMYAGSFVEIGPTEEIIKRPRHPYTKALIASLPQVGVQHKHKRLMGIAGTPPSLLNIEGGCRFRYRCPYLTELCQESPAAAEIDSDHLIACWNWLDTGSDDCA
jgi:peptide/nickel transport system ATP-binding protein